MLLVAVAHLFLEWPSPTSDIFLIPSWRQEPSRIISSGERMEQASLVFVYRSYVAEFRVYESQRDSSCNKSRDWSHNDFCVSNRVGAHFEAQASLVRHFEREERGRQLCPLKHD